MPNNSYNEILIVDGESNKHLLLTNENGVLVTKALEEDLTVQPYIDTNCSEITLSAFDGTAGIACPNLTDTFLTVGMFKETGVYLVDYSLIGKYEIYEGDEVVQADATFTLSTTHYFSYQSKKIVAITDLDTFTISLFSSDDELENKVNTHPAVLSLTLGSGALVLANSTNVTAFTSVLVSLTATKNVVLTKLA